VRNQEHGSASYQTPLDHIHQVGATVFGLGLTGFGLLGLVKKLDLL
jgi:hypothetical protein